MITLADKDNHNQVTLEKQYIELFKSHIFAEKCIDDVVLRVFENRLYHVKIPRFKKITMDFIEKGYEFIEEVGGGRYCNIFEFDSFSDVEPEVRTWASDNKQNFNTISDAFVINSLSQKILADFYLRVHKPEKPTRVFYNLEKAVVWSLEQREIYLTQEKSKS
ncbi:MAG: hypothetical protein COA38_20885 [Fluviicola sp.]|nr:MAG: hypothetical protein COA38_20885 [Fluviicola sp.]